MPNKHKLAVWKLSSCDGCQLSILDLEDELLLLSESVDVAHFLEASSHQDEGPFDISLVEGSVSAPQDEERVTYIREHSRYVIAIGACANAGGIQALRNYASHNEFLNIVYASPQYISSLETSKPISEYIHVDYELQGCPINKTQMLETLVSFIYDKKPAISATSVCTECKLNGTPCLFITKNIPCLGPVTHAGCGALCPSFNRGCYGCYGPQESSHPQALAQHLEQKGMSNHQIMSVFRSYQADNPIFKTTSQQYEDDYGKKDTDH